MASTYLSETFTLERILKRSIKHIMYTSTKLDIQLEQEALGTWHLDIYPVYSHDGTCSRTEDKKKNTWQRDIHKEKKITILN